MSAFTVWVKEIWTSDTEMFEKSMPIQCSTAKPMSFLSGATAEKTFEDWCSHHGSSQKNCNVAIYRDSWAFLS
jgi:hypothetical protein